MVNCDIKFLGPRLWTVCQLRDCREVCSVGLLQVDVGGAAVEGGMACEKRSAEPVTTAAAAALVAAAPREAPTGSRISATGAGCCTADEVGVDGCTDRGHRCSREAGRTTFLLHSTKSVQQQMFVLETDLTAGMQSCHCCCVPQVPMGSNVGLDV